MTDTNKPKHNATAFEVEAYDDLRKPGAYRFFRGAAGTPAGIAFGCPCGCGLIGSVYFVGANDNGPEWAVNGEWPNASLTPSIGFYGRNSFKQGHHWHGYLTKGVFEEC